MRPTTIGNIINDLCRSWGIERRLKEYNAISQWSNIVGERIAKEARPLSLKRGKLFLYVEKAAWRNELTFMKKDIIQKMNRAIGTPLVRDIIISTKKGANQRR